MFKSSSHHRQGLFKRTRAGSVTVIDARVHNAAAQKAKLAFILTWLVTGLFTAAVVSANTENMIWVGFLGAVIGLPFAMLAWTVVRVWPVLRVIWWWLPQLLLGMAALWLLAKGATTIGAAWTLVIAVAVVGVPMAIGPVRRPTIAVVWCQVMRHRVRKAFADYIKTSQHGTLPLILLAKPTPAGTRLWIHLRSGLSKDDVERWLPKLAATCVSDQVTVERASAVNSAFLRLDIKRRNVLKDRVSNPLLCLIDRALPKQAKERAIPPTALNLRDITDEALTDGVTFKPESLKRESAKTASTNGSHGSVPASDADDMSDWV